MIRFQVITLFPEIVSKIAQLGLLARASTDRLIEFSGINLRDFAINTHGQVDDSPYGGGAGMVLRPEPLAAAIEQAKSRDPEALVINFSPRGRVYTQEIARSLSARAQSKKAGFILIAGRYEGIDQRIIDRYVDEEISLGDFVLMGGDLPALTFSESVVRLFPGVLGNSVSALDESFSHNLLEHPQYTKPMDWQGMSVPETLATGNHAQIADMRATWAQTDTLTRRPDLINRSGYPRLPLSAALIHHPVLDKQGQIITSSLTNLDIHDIARSGRTYGLDRYYIVHPLSTMRRLAEKVCRHWVEGYGLTYNPNRSDALDIISVLPDLDDVILNIEARHGRMPKIITTSARESKSSRTFEEMRAHLMLAKEPHLILFGTGWGLAAEVLERADYHLEPICGPSDYNHLSVRAAAAIIFDRLCAPPWYYQKLNSK